MEKNLFQQAKDKMMNFTNDRENHQNARSEKDIEAIRQAIQDAYNEATPEEQEQLKQFEQQLDQNMNLH